MRLYLITGFLGAGKTTFLKNFIKQFASEKLFLIINEFGRVGVDGALLREVNAELAEINNGSIFCSCRLDKFEEALLCAIDAKPDIILVEASGLADPTNIGKVLQNKQFAKIDYMGGVCMADASGFAKVVHTASSCKKQILAASLVLLNKTDLVTKEKAENAVSLIKEINPDISVMQTVNGAFQKEWLCLVKPRAEADMVPLSPDITLQKACVTLSTDISEKELCGFLSMLVQDTYRIKGFVYLSGKLYLADCVSAEVRLTPHQGKGADVGQIILLAGKGMPLRKSLKQAVNWYKKYVLEVQYD